MTLAPAVVASELAPHTTRAGCLAICSPDPNTILAPAATTTAASASPAAAAQSATPPAVPAHHSNASAKAKLFLDFDGHFEAKWDDKKNIRTPAFDHDGNPNSFNSSEQAAIDEIWARVAEDFAPFNIDVTTVDPGSYKHGVVAVIAIGGSDSDWFHDSAAGVALVTGFTATTPASNVGFVFSRTLDEYPPDVADAASHEAGHLFGLLHQALWNGNSLVDDYNPGNNYSAPIMGVSYYADRSTWSNDTPDSSPNVIQDDMAIIASPENGFGYRADDYPDTIQSAAALSLTGPEVNLKGLIGRSNDQDVWKITTPAGIVGFELDVTQYGSNLDADLELWASDGTVIARSNPLTDLNAKVLVTVPAGTYYLVARGAGDYGDVGQYAIRGSIGSSVPEIDVTVDGVALPNSGILDFGITTVGQPVLRTITITNSGSWLLNLGPVRWTRLFDAVTLVSNSNFDGSWLNPGESRSFTLQLDATKELDLQSASIQFDNGDPDEGTFTINLRGHVNLAPEPPINVSLDGVNVLNSNLQPINFGTTPPKVPLTKSFTVTNEGTDTFTLGPIDSTNWPGFTLISDLANTVLGPGESTEFSVRLDSASSGEFPGNVRLRKHKSSDPAQLEYFGELWFKGTVKPALEVRNNGELVPNPGPIDFGNAIQGTPRVMTLTVANVSDSEVSLLPLTPGDMPSGFALVSNFINTTLEPGQTTTFAISLDAAAVGEHSGNLHLVNADNADDRYGLLLTGVVFAPGPDIDLSFYGQSIADGGTLNLGNIFQGDTAYANLTVTNQGTTRLNLTPLSAKMPSGFSLVSNIDSASLAPGESTTFTIAINAAKLGPISGTFQLKSNDGDESVYDFTISGIVTTPQGPLIDNGDAGNTFSGNWKRYSGNGYAHDLNYAYAGKGYMNAVWTFNNLAPGQYRVDATWTGNRKNASDAPFTLFDGQDPLAFVRVNQRVAPGAQTVAGRWKQLGTITVTSGQLVVQLTNDANGLVIADAVRIELVNTVDFQPKVINPTSALAALPSSANPLASTQPPTTVSYLVSSNAPLPSPTNTTSDSPDLTTAPATPPTTAIATASDPAKSSDIQSVDDVMTGLSNDKTSELANILDPFDSEQATA